MAGVANMEELVLISQEKSLQRARYTLWWKTVILERFDGVSFGFERELDAGSRYSQIAEQRYCPSEWSRNISYLNWQPKNATASMQRDTSFVEKIHLWTHLWY